MYKNGIELNFPKRGCFKSFFLRCLMERKYKIRLNRLKWTHRNHIFIFFQVRGAIRSATRALNAKFFPDYLGFPHISRNEVIEHHTTFGKTAFLQDNDRKSGFTSSWWYLYLCSKEQNVTFSRQSYSLHKHRPLVKLMLQLRDRCFHAWSLSPGFQKQRRNHFELHH